jgi:hypothetical protein
MKISATSTAGNVRIQRYILFCRIVNSAEQSKHQLLLGNKNVSLLKGSTALYLLANGKHRIVDKNEFSQNNILLVPVLY